jgi:hypothetical protein
MGEKLLHAGGRTEVTLTDIHVSNMKVLFGFCWELLSLILMLYRRWLHVFVRRSNEAINVMLFPLRTWQEEVRPPLQRFLSILLIKKGKGVQRQAEVALGVPVG